MRNGLHKIDFGLALAGPASQSLRLPRMRAAYTIRRRCDMSGMPVRRKLAGLAAMAAVLLLALLWASPAGAGELVEFEKEAALAANGPIPPVPANPLEEVKEAVCRAVLALR